MNSLRQLGQLQDLIGNRIPSEPVVIAWPLVPFQISTRTRQASLLDTHYRCQNQPAKSANDVVVADRGGVARLKC